MKWMRGREVVERVALKDPVAAARYLGRPLSSEDACAAVSDVADIVAEAPEWVRQIAEETEDRLARRMAAWGLAPDRASVRERFILLRALAEGRGEGLAPRTFCRRIGLGSKAYEKHAAGLTGMIRHALGVDEDGVQSVLGFLSYLPPIMLRGPVRVTVEGGMVLDGLVSPYLPIAPEWSKEVSATASAKAVLTVENLTSFHRQVRECPQDDVVVVYLGGFPNRLLRSALDHLARQGLPFHHWGDVDAGGVRIVRYLRDRLGIPISLHAMSPDLAGEHGMAFSAPPRIAADPKDDVDLANLVEFLRSDRACWLEQETLPPSPFVSRWWADSRAR